MTPVGEPPAAALSSIRSRSWSDFLRLTGSHRFRAFAGVMVALGAGVGALAPSNASGGKRFLIATGAALAAPLLAYLVALLWSFLRAPLRQRRELIAHFDDAEAAPQPLLKMEAAVDIREKGGFGLLNQPRPQSVAFIRVYNAQERGGPAATAEHVSPEIKVFAPGDRLIYHRKGWDVNAWRDFTTNQEEHAFWLVAKLHDAEGCFLIKDEAADPALQLGDGVYVAELTLHGYMPDSPIRKRFVFSSRGAGTDLTLEAEDAQPSRFAAASE